MLDARLLRVQLPGRKQVSLEGLSCEVAPSPTDSQAVLLLHKEGWLSPVSLDIPLKHLGSGSQDVSVYARQLGYVSLSVSLVAEDRPQVRAAAAQQQEAEQRRQTEMAEQLVV